jgi:hypothetical protein
VFAALGAAATVFTRHDDDGEVVSTLEWVIVGASTVSAMVAAASAPWRADHLIPKPDGGTAIHASHSVYAGTDLVMTSASLVCGAVAFGYVMDKVGNSRDPNEIRRVKPEAFGGTAGFLDQTGTITSNVATLLPMAAIVAKGVLLAVTGGTKAGALAFKLLELGAVKKVL